VLGLGLYSNFSQAATIAAIVRLVLFLATCGALIVFRRRDREPIGFRVPGGQAVAVAGIVFCVWLLSTRSFAQAWMLLAIMAAGAVLWFAGRRGWFGVVSAT
jgi:amino acid transporter